VEVILGVDPGLTRCGYGVISGNKAVDYGHFTSSPTQDPRDRVGSIADSLDRIISTHKPVLIAIERVFAQANLRSVMGVAQISGALMALAFKHDIPLEFFTPSEVKLAVAGHGRADKAQVVRKWLSAHSTWKKPPNRRTLPMHWRWRFVPPKERRDWARMPNRSGSQQPRVPTAD